MRWCQEKSSKRIQTGEPIIDSRSSRYLIDFITGILGVSSGLPHLAVTTAWTRTLHPTTIPQTNRRWPTMRANFRIEDLVVGKLDFRANRHDDFVGD